MRVSTKKRLKKVLAYKSKSKQAKLPYYSSYECESFLWEDPIDFSIRVQHDAHGECSGGKGFNTYTHGDRGLWCAVIKLAVDDLSSNNKRLQLKAKAFFSPRIDSHFDYICRELLDLEPDKIRSQLRKDGLL